MKLELPRLLKLGQHFNRFPEVFRCREHTAQWLHLTAEYIGLKADLPFEVSFPAGKFEFVERSDVATFWQIFYRRIYRVAASDLLIVDAGANIGAFTLYALLTAPQAKVIAIEPAPDSFNRLKSMLSANGLDSRCELHEAALGERSGKTTIQLGTGSQFRRTGISGHPVKMVTLESLIPPGAVIDLLKMDIEGAEYGVLNSTSAATLHQIRQIDLEFHPQAPAKTAIDRLTDSGFTLKHYQDDGAGYGVASLERN
jgi:FkbM family methyltransferase